MVGDNCARAGVLLVPRLAGHGPRSIFLGQRRDLHAARLADKRRKFGPRFLSREVLFVLVSRHRQHRDKIGLEAAGHYNRCNEPVRALGERREKNERRFRIALLQLLALSGDFFGKPLRVGKLAMADAP